MQVSSHAPYVPAQNSTVDNLEKYKELSTQEQDKVRGVAVGIAAHHSKEAQIDAYIAGSGHDGSDESETNTQAYVDFASDVRRANHIETVANSDFEPKGNDSETLPAKPTPLERFQELSVNTKRNEAIQAYESNAIGLNIA